MKIEAPEGRDKALADVARNALKLAPELTAEAIKQLSTDSVERQSLLGYCAKVLTELNQEEALAWAASLGAAKDIDAARAEIALVLVSSDPERAISLISPSAIADGGPDGTAAKVLHRWTASAPADAAAWVIKLPPGGSRKVGIKSVASQWLMANAQAALSWAAALDNASVRKDVTRVMAETLVRQPPPIRELLLGPTDPGIRSELEQQVDQITQEEAKASTPPPPKRSGKTRIPPP